MSKTTITTTAICVLLTSMLLKADEKPLYYSYGGRNYVDNLAEQHYWTPETDSIHSGADYAVDGAHGSAASTLRFTNTCTFDGDSLTIMTGGILMSQTRTCSLSCANLVFDGGSFNNNQEGTTGTIKGNCFVSENGATVGPENCKIIETKDTEINSTLTSADKTAINFITVVYSTVAADATLLDVVAKSRITGDCSGYLGQYTIVRPYKSGSHASEYRLGAVLSLESATALAGNPGEEYAKVVMDSPSKLHLSASAAANAHEDNYIQVTGAENYLKTVTDDEVVVVTSAIRDNGSETGRIIKVGAGEIKFDCSFGLDGESCLEIAEGTAVIGAGADFGAGLKIVVRSGARLVFEKYTSEISLTAEEGAEVVYPVFEIGYDPATGAVTPVTIESGIPSWPIKFTLSNPVAMPSDHFSVADAKVVMRIARDVKSDLCSDDLVFVPSAGSCGLPKATLSVVGSGSYFEVRMVANPIITYVGDLTRNFSDATDRYGNSTWSDEAAIHENADYVMNNGKELVTRNAYGYDDDAVFSGHSLTVGNGSDIECRSKSLFIGDVTLLPAGKILFSTSKERVPDIPFNGTLTLSANGSANPPADGSYFEIPDSAAPVKVNASVRGDGYLTLLASKSIGHVVTFCGDNSDWIGGIMSSYDSSQYKNRGIVVAFDHPHALGGDKNPETIDWASTWLRGDSSLLRPLKSMTFNRKGRSIQVSQGGFDIPEDVVFSVLEPVSILDWAVKIGEGALYLGQNLRYGLYHSLFSDADMHFYVREGYLGTRGGKSIFSNLHNLDVSDGAGFIVDPQAAGEAKEYGLYLPHDVNALGALAVVSDKVSGKELMERFKSRELTEPVTVAICTIPTASPVAEKIFTSANKKALALPHFSAEFLTDEPETGMTRYLVRYTCKGFGFVISFK